MKTIVIKTIPQSKQRYPTVGDYWRDPDGTLQIRVSEMGNTDYEALVALHELIEIILTEKKGIKEPDIMAFDVQFEKEREEGLHAEDDEPGEAPNSPYRKEHVLAECLERVVANELGVIWDEYGKTVMAL